MCVCVCVWGGGGGGGACVCVLMGACVCMHVYPFVFVSALGSYKMGRHMQSMMMMMMMMMMMIIVSLVCCCREISRSFVECYADHHTGEQCYSHWFFVLFCFVIYMCVDYACSGSGILFLFIYFNKETKQTDKKGGEKVHKQTKQTPGISNIWIHPEERQKVRVPNQGT